jgi:ABC-type polysaccharide/polyol phosphate transport system, ATPase component
MATAIEFNHVSKQYRLGVVSTRTLSHDLNRWWQVNVLHREDPYLKIGSVNDRSVAADSEYVWALRDIDFKVEQGDVVGIIGNNGAGKSTMLKLLSRVTGPTAGTIRVRGRIGSLLEVGTGFHPEMTGRENIFMNGAILGMTKSEITRKLDEIIDFSGCERYIDTPVKRYSSGMMVRLGFAVAAHLDPEILVVDEVLAVGDAEFQRKAIGKMQEVSQGEGRTVLFVSHNMASVRQLCKKGVLLDMGRIQAQGGVDDIVNLYLGKEIQKGEENHLWSLETGPKYGSIIVLKSLVEYQGASLDSSMPFDLVYEFYNAEEGLTLSVNPHVYNESGICLFNVSTTMEKLNKGVHRAVFHVPGGLFCAGNYRVDNMYCSRNTCYFNHRNSNSFEIQNGRNDFWGHYLGVYYPTMIKSSFFKVSDDETDKERH